MPKYVPKKASMLSVMAVVIILIGVALVYPANIVVLLGMVMLVMIWGYFDKPRINKFYDDLCAQRESLSICDFSNEFDCKEVDTWIIRAVYEQIQENIPFDKKIPIKANDNLKKDLGFDDDDIDLDLAGQISQRTSRTMEGFDKNPYYGKVHTVKDLVLFFNNQPHESAK